jgi:hypothetical protein
MRIQILPFTLLQIQILLFTLMQIKIQLPKTMSAHAHANPDLEHWYLYDTTCYSTQNQSFRSITFWGGSGSGSADPCL